MKNYFKKILLIGFMLFSTIAHYTVMLPSSPPKKGTKTTTPKTGGKTGTAARPTSTATTGRTAQQVAKAIGTGSKASGTVRPGTGKAATGKITGKAVPKGGGATGTTAPKSTTKKTQKATTQPPQEQRPPSASTIAIGSGSGATGRPSSARPSAPSIAPTKVPATTILTSPSTGIVGGGGGAAGAALAGAKIRHSKATPLTTTTSTTTPSSIATSSSAGGTTVTMTVAAPKGKLSAETSDATERSIKIIALLTDQKLIDRNRNINWTLEIQKNPIFFEQVTQNIQSALTIAQSGPIDVITELLNPMKNKKEYLLDVFLDVGRGKQYYEVDSYYPLLQTLPEYLTLKQHIEAAVAEANTEPLDEPETAQPSSAPTASTGATATSTTSSSSSTSGGGGGAAGAALAGVKAKSIAIPLTTTTSTTTPSSVTTSASAGGTTAVTTTAAPKGQFQGKRSAITPEAKANSMKIIGLLKDPNFSNQMEQNVDSALKIAQEGPIDATSTLVEGKVLGEIVTDIGKLHPQLPYRFKKWNQLIDDVQNAEDEPE